MSMPAETRRRWTPEAVRELMEREPGYWPRYELIDGELLVTPAPRPAHQFVHSCLYEVIAPYVRREGVGRLFGGPSDLTLHAESIVQPDLYVVPPPQAAGFRTWSEITRLVLVIEILSPSTTRRDRGAKREYYQRAAVDEYWIVDLKRREIERWLPNAEGPEVARERLVWQPAGATAPLLIELDELWSAARLD